MSLHLTSVAASPQRPEGLSDLEGVVTSSDTPAVLMVGRAWMRELLAYLRFLERATGREGGSFW